MAYEKVRIKVRHYRFGVLYPRGEVVTLPGNLEFSDVLHELLEPAPKLPEDKPEEQEAPDSPPAKKKAGKRKAEAQDAEVTDSDTDI